MAPYRTILSFLLLFILSFAAQASTILTIGQEAIRLTDFRVEYFTDDSQSLSYEEVRKQTFQETTSSTSLGAKAAVTWFRFTLRNSSLKARALLLHLPSAYHARSVDIFQERSQNLIDQASVDLNDASDHLLMYQGTVVYPFTVPLGETVVVYVRSHVYSHQWFSLEIYDNARSRQALVGGHLDIALLVGILLAMVLYNALLYFATSKSENIFYSLYLISGLAWIALSYGLLGKAFNIYGDAVFVLNLALITMPIFLLLFMMSIFETEEFYPTEHRVLQGMLALLAITLVYGLFDAVGALKPAASLAVLLMVVTFSVGISLLRKGHPLVKYFLVGHTFFVVFNGIAVLYYKGLVAPNYINGHGVGIGIVLEALTLAFIISYRIKVLENIRSKQNEFKQQAATDPLTQLYNRRQIVSEGEYIGEKARAAGEPLSVIALDIDHFKAVNDEHGHHVGDSALVDIAGILRQYSRDTDLVARVGGEEFVILLPGADHAEARSCAELIRRGVERHVVGAGDGLDVRITVSIGVAEVDTAMESVESAVNRADKALYEAKALGRNRVCCSEAVAGGASF
jgi:diguanylate cyclase (GGDEF)-like protein